MAKLVAQSGQSFWQRAAKAAKLSCKSGQTFLPFAVYCKFNISFAAAAKLALVISKAKLSLRIVALLHSPLDTVLFL
jgi:hypothetical protein